MAGTGGWRRELRSFFSWGWRFSPGPVPATNIDLPLTTAHVFALRHHVRTERQWFLGCMAFCATFAAIFPLVGYQGQSPPLGLMVTVAGAVVTFAVLIDWLGWRRGHEAEMRAGVYFRVSGPIRVFKGKQTGDVRVGDVTIKHISSAICASLRDLPFGYIDYAPRSRLVIEQRDADGELLYRFPAYRPDDDPTVTRRLPGLVRPILWGMGLCIGFVLGVVGLAMSVGGRR